MHHLLVYIIQVNFALVLFYLLYLLLFKRDTFLRLRRIYFLSALVFSLVYPMFVVPGLSEVWNFRTEEPQGLETAVFIEAPTFEMIVEEPEEANDRSVWERMVNGWNAFNSKLKAIF